MISVRFGLVLDGSGKSFSVNPIALRMAKTP